MWSASAMFVPGRSAVVPTAADYYEFRFGFGTGFIDKGHLEPVQGKQRVEDRLGILINR